MRKIFDTDLNKYKVRVGNDLSSLNIDAYPGFYNLPGPCGKDLFVICGEAYKRWEHVSVSVKNRTPNWMEMDHVKKIFWDDEETVIQFHPRESAKINYHPFCLHLWKIEGMEFSLPPPETIAPMRRKVR